MPPSHEPLLLLSGVLLVVVSLVVLIARFKVHAFIALTLASLAIGLISRMKVAAIAVAFQEGVGAMLGSVALVVGLGMVMGRMLAESGGAEVVARTLIGAFGRGRLDWAMMLVGFVVGIPVFFTVGVVLLIPILLTLVREGRQPLLFVAIPLLAGLSAAHGLLPPHPGPMAAIGIMGADPGRTLLYALGIGLVTSMVAGPLLGSLLTSRVRVLSKSAAGGITTAGTSPLSTPPSFPLALFTIVLPVLLMLTATVADLVLGKDSALRAAADLVGSPVVAMLIATLFSFYSFGIARGFTRSDLLRFAEDCLAPAGSILLVVGAGGGFNKVLVAGGVGDAMAALARSAQLSPLLLGWLVAALIRIATGSATVAITTAAGIVAPFAAGVGGTNMELLVIATGAGSLILSHVNDGGFWFVKEYLGLTVPQTLWTWTVLETVLSVIALLLVLMLNWL